MSNHNDNDFDFDLNSNGQSSASPGADEQPQPKRHYTDKQNYRGKVLEQSFFRDFQNTPTLALRVELEGELSDQRDPRSTVFPCVPGTATIRIQFPDDDSRMEMAVKDLIAHGYHHDDLEPLVEGSPDHFSFVGMTVCLAPTYKKANGKLNCYWNLRALGRDETPIARGEGSAASELFTRVRRRVGGRASPASSTAAKPASSAKGKGKGKAEATGGPGF